MTNDALLGAVIAAPADDTPRLVFADWFEENGQPERAEFIRVQVERARLPAGDVRHGELLARELRLLARGGRAWAAGIPTLEVVRFRRGFVESVGAFADVLADNAEELFRKHPIRELRVTGTENPGDGERLARRPELARVEHIRVDDFAGGQNDPDATQTLLTSPHWTSVTGLTLITGLAEDTLRAVLRHPGFAGVRELRINTLRADDVTAVLADFPHLPVEVLWVNPGHMGMCSISAAGFRRLVESPHWSRLRELDIGVSPWEPRYADLSEVMSHANLRTLRLRVNYPNAGTNTVGTFLQAKSWGELDSLMIDDYSLDVPQLLAHPGLGKLRELELPRLRSDAADRVFTCPALGGLHKLTTNFGCNPGAIGSLRATPMAGLRELLIGSGDPASTRALVGSPHLRGLHTLTVGNLDAESTRVLAGADLPALARLVLVGGRQSRLTPAAAHQLATSPQLPNLASLDLYFPAGGYDADRLGPLLDAESLPWLAVHTNLITDPATRDRYEARLAAVGGLLPPLDAISERAWYPDA